MLRRWDDTATNSRTDSEVRIAASELLFVCAANVPAIDASEQACGADSLIALGFNAGFAHRFSAIVGVTPLDEPSLRRLVGAVDFGILSPVGEGLTTDDQS
jgi:hypothetical protein